MTVSSSNKVSKNGFSDVEYYNEVLFLRQASFAAAVALLFLSPFERLDPIVSGSLQDLSNLELVLAVALGLWMLSTLKGDLRRWQTRLTIPLFLLTAVLLVSALLAPAFNGQALRFTGRFVAAVLVCLMVADLGNSTRRLTTMLSAIAASGTVVALLGVLEFFETGWVLALIDGFREGPNYAGSQLRAGSTLQYPTIASMYLEIVFALGMGLLLFALHRKDRLAASLIFASQLVVGSCVILTLTRTGPVSLALVFLLAAAATYRTWGLDAKIRLMGVLGGALLMVLFASNLVSQESWLRWTSYGPGEWYQVRYQVPDRLQLQPGELRVVEVKLQNTGLASWRPGGEIPFRLAYHWFSADGLKVVDWEGIRSELPRPVQPGETVLVRASVRAPDRPGDYRLAWDMLQEHRFWFSKETAPSRHTRVEVRGEPSGDTVLMAQDPPLPRFVIARTRLWAIAAEMLRNRPLLGVGPDNFRLLYGEYAGLAIFDRTYHTHNLFIEFFVNTGLLGGVLFLWVATILLTTLIRLSRTASRNSLPLVIGVSAAVLVIFAHGLLDYFLEFTPTYLMIFAVFGMVMAMAPPRKLEAHSQDSTE